MAGLRSRLHPQRLGHFVPLSFRADGGKIQATRFAGSRRLLPEGEENPCYFLPTPSSASASSTIERIEAKTSSGRGSGL